MSAMVLGCASLGSDVSDPLLVEEDAVVPGKAGTGGLGRAGAGGFGMAFADTGDFGVARVGDIGTGNGPPRPDIPVGDAVAELDPVALLPSAGPVTPDGHPTVAALSPSSSSLAGSVIPDGGTTSATSTFDAPLP